MTMPQTPAGLAQTFENMADGEWRTLVDLARYRGIHQSGKLGFTFLKDGETEIDHLTFGDLDRRARAAGAALRARGVTGGRVLLLYPQGLEFIVGFFAALYAGATAVPAPSANAGRVAKARILGIIDDSEPLIALTLPDLIPDAERILTSDSGAHELAAALPVASLQQLEAEAPEDDTPPAIDPDFMALLQYTSGSTGTPRGVMVSHSSILANEAMIRLRFEHSADTVFIGWLPMFHDMGLIGNMLQPVYVGCRCVLMSPAAFLQEPARWLRAVTKYRGTTAGAPNFAFDLCVDRISAEQRVGLDLSSWDVAYNGSEPVRARTFERFAESFAPLGFKPEALYPCYGMAEATLLISGPEKSIRPLTRVDDTHDGTETHRLVGCGRTGPDHDVRIVDPETKLEMPPEAVGEIWFSGGSVAQGYWRRPTETAADFNVKLADAPTGRGYMRTGDLGFVADGQVFVTGRIKDVMIVRGKNHYPQDVEVTAQGSHAGFKPNGTAAFLVRDGDRDKLVVVQEVVFSAMRNTPVKEMAGQVRSAVSQEHGLHVVAVVLLKTASIPKTSSGKIQRRLCRERYLAGTLAIVGEDRHGPAMQTKTKAPVGAEH